MPIILVTGATGKQGSAVISHLLRSPLRPTIRALTRSPTSPASLALAGKGVQLVKGSLDDRASLVKALEGAESAFLVNADSPVELEQGKTFISVAKDVGLGFLVYASAEGAGASPPALHKKLAIEEALKTSGLRFTILRPVAFFENLPSEPGVMRWLTLAVMDSALKGKRLQMVATDDIGHFAVRAMEDPQAFNGRIIAFGGDDLSMTEVAKTFSKVRGSKASKGPRWLGAVVLRFMPEDKRELLHWFGQPGYSVDLQKLREEYPGALSFEEWVKRTE